MTAKKQSPPSPDPAQNLLILAENTACALPIVGIGASAGGLEAFEQFFRNTPEDSGFAFVLVSHLDPNRPSLLTEILQRSTTMPVVEAKDQMPVAPNHVYIIPPNRDLSIFHGSLYITEPGQPREQRLPIDMFFRSLAEDQQQHAIGIILSGTGTDGTLGCRAIFGVGGITLVQEPGTAKYNGMPNSVINAGYATHILPADQLPEALLAGSRLRTVSPEKILPTIAISGMNPILMQLRSATGHDFSLYKKSTISRRIERRMLQHNIEDTDTYARYLKETPVEVRALFKELLINVTSFFRDSEAFIVLQQEILPQLCQDKPENYEFRVWVPGCATGEEAYSLAILLQELIESTHQALKVQIYATDLAEDAITIARAGFYPPNIIQDVSPERLHSYFTKVDDGYQIKKEIRDKVVFAVQNIIKDPPFTKLDLLSCRNLMIYLEHELQNRLIPMFHYSLKPDGVLFLSPSESIGNHTGLFLVLNRKWKCYSANHANGHFSGEVSHHLSWNAEKSHIKYPEQNMTQPKDINVSELTRRSLLECYAPASVVIDSKGTILYVHGDTGKYLRPAPGLASLNVLEMAREGLERELRAAIRSATIAGLPTLSRELQVKTNGGFTGVSLSVRILSNNYGNPALLLVSFQDSAIPVQPTRKRAKPNELGRTEELEHDMTHLREIHQVTLREQQLTNEELKSTNEEMQATNEELQSSNEELETSKEELQSINEGLTTVNSELQSKCEQLVTLQNDMKNLLDNTSVGIIFLDRHLIIRSFTREAVNVYRLVASDVGRPLNDIKSVVDGDGLLVAAQGVLDTLIPYEHEIRTIGDTWILVRIQAYRTVDHVIDGVVLTFTDITSRIKAIKIQTALTMSEGIIGALREPIVVLDGSLKVVLASNSFYREFKFTPEQTVDRLIYELGNGQWNIPSLHEVLEAVLLQDARFENYAVEHDFPDIAHRHLLLNARHMVGIVDEPQLILLSINVSHEG